jgi:hypothetical protein
MSCAPKLVFDGTVGFRSRFYVLRSRTRFRRCGGRRVQFSCFALLDSFSALPRASGPVSMLCAPEHVLGGTVGVGSCFHVLRSWTYFRRHRGRRVPFSCFASPSSFSAIPRALGPVFMRCAHQIRFRRYRGCQISFSCFVFPDSFSAEP